LLSLFSQIFKLFKDSLGVQTSIIVALAVVAVVVAYNIGKRMNRFNGACEGFGYCRFNVFVSQLELIRRTLGPIKTDIKQSFAMTLINKDVDFPASTSKKIGQAIKQHKTLIDAAFRRGKKELINLIIRNNIPDADTPAFRVYVDDNFNVFESAIWEYVGEQWDEDILILSYQQRKQNYTNHRDHFKAVFADVITESRMIGTKAKAKYKKGFWG
jgi:hypothetical protein